MLKKGDGMYYFCLQTHVTPPPFNRTTQPAVSSAPSSELGEKQRLQYGPPRPVPSSFQSAPAAATLNQQPTNPPAAVPTTPSASQSATHTYPPPTPPGGRSQLSGRNHATTSSEDGVTTNNSPGIKVSTHAMFLITIIL